MTKTFLTKITSSIAALALIFLAVDVSAALTPRQEVIVLKELNDFCADTWCESGTEFTFTKLTCVDEEKTCDLFFDTQDNSTEDTPVYKQVCQVQPFSRFEQMVTTEGHLESGFQTANLNDSFIEQVNHCAEPFFQ